MVSFAPLPATVCWRHRSALDLSTERLEQSYTRLPGESRHQRYRYAAPAFGFTCTLVYDESGLVLDYPGIAIRAR
jgi:hypothetical protein